MPQRITAGERVSRVARPRRKSAARRAAQQLLGLAVGSLAVLQRLRKLHPRGGELELAALHLHGKGILVQALAHRAVGIHQVGTLVDAPEHFQESEILERHRVHVSVGVGCGRAASHFPALPGALGPKHVATRHAAARGHCR